MAKKANRQTRTEKQKMYRQRFNRTYKGHALKLYDGMLRRVKTEPSYVRRNIRLLVSKERFIKWVLNDPHYNLLHFKWIESGFQEKFAPSVDRIDSSKHYSLSNIQILNKSDNSRKQ